MLTRKKRLRKRLDVRFIKSPFKELLKEFYGIDYESF